MLLSTLVFQAQFLRQHPSQMTDCRLTTISLHQSPSGQSFSMFQLTTTKPTKLEVIHPKQFLTFIIPAMA
ncbi:hypothetical protein C7S15_2647 [Burkholderia cepacia]|nr:hypothetical protein [Burkholderia cepacia]